MAGGWSPDSHGSGAAAASRRDAVGKALLVSVRELKKSNGLTRGVEVVIFIGDILREFVMIMHDHILTDATPDRVLAPRVSETVRGWWRAAVWVC